MTLIRVGLRPRQVHTGKAALESDYEFQSLGQAPAGRNMVRHMHNIAPVRTKDLSLAVALTTLPGLSRGVSCQGSTQISHCLFHSISPQVIAA